jgi:purine-binding chemotaxis protein CheW
MQFVTVFVAGEELGLPVERVREIVETRPITRVPSMPKAIEGVANVRGRVVPVVDLGATLKLSGSAGGRWSCLALVDMELDGEPLLLALHADAIGQVLELEEKQVLPAPTFGTRVRLDYLRGVAASGDRFALLLDLDRVLAPSELLAAAELAEETPGGGA